jgi:hypothetical protein
VFQTVVSLLEVDEENLKDECESEKRLDFTSTLCLGCVWFSPQYDRKNLVNTSKSFEKFNNYLEDPPSGSFINQNIPLCIKKYFHFIVLVLRVSASQQRLKKFHKTYKRILSKSFFPTFNIDVHFAI